jgi:hypothetical protein
MIMVLLWLYYIPTNSSMEYPHDQKSISIMRISQQNPRVFSQFPHWYIAQYIVIIWLLYG